eukprot:TRINITY_DN53651_c0_g1_i1.p1 TRINITY_DN53651_c0_g1~~TRINITY_DN53651_c0_g1_i1.p1  ORF type:complete len:165 (-),score=20.66 TRINITY_DN53651_c0_g1_i1:118-546(-)
MAPKSKSTGAKTTVRKTRKGSEANLKADGDTFIVILEWSHHHDGSPDTSDIVGVYSCARAANDAVLDQFCEYVWHDHPKGQKLHDAAAKKKGLLDLEYGTDGSFGEGEIIRCRVEKHMRASDCEREYGFVKGKIKSLRSQRK